MRKQKQESQEADYEGIDAKRKLQLRGNHR